MKRELIVVILVSIVAIITLPGCELMQAATDLCIKAIKAFVKVELNPGSLPNTCVFDIHQGFCNVNCESWLLLAFPDICTGAEYDFLKEGGDCFHCPQLGSSDAKDLALWGLCASIDNFIQNI